MTIKVKKKFKNCTKCQKIRFIRDNIGFVKHLKKMNELNVLNELEFEFTRLIITPILNPKHPNPK